MDTFKMKTYADSYLYNELSKDSGKSFNKAIKDFIIKSHRIDKHSQAFSGIVEEVKRHQSSPVLLSILFNENVILCIGDAELPVAFKVFDAKDSKSGNRPKVFIDLTGRLEFKNGYYIIRRNEADKLCALLFDALIYLLYRNQRFKLTNNANIVLSSTKCYVSMFNYILDYLRIIGFAQNKNKISYLTAIYFLHGMIGYNIDDYVKNIAARVAGIGAKEANAYMYYIDDESMFENIGTFVPAIADIFKLKGLDLSVFVNRWTNSFGPGTEYATELFTSFLVTLVNAYTGSYIIRQRQIETACGDANLVKVANAIIHAGSDSYGGYIEGVNMEVHSEESEELRSALSVRENTILNGVTIDRFDSIDTVNESANNIINACKEAKIENKMRYYIQESLANGINLACDSSWSLLHGEDPDYTTGTLTEAVKVLNKYIDTDTRYNLNKMVSKSINNITSMVEEYEYIPSTIRKEVMDNVIELTHLKSIL